MVLFGTPSCPLDKCECMILSAVLLRSDSPDIVHSPFVKMTD